MNYNYLDRLSIKIATYKHQRMPKLRKVHFILQTPLPLWVLLLARELAQSTWSA